MLLSLDVSTVFDFLTLGILVLGGDKIFQVFKLLLVVYSEANTK